jgi:hypothetical protein
MVMTGMGPWAPPSAGGPSPFLHAGIKRALQARRGRRRGFMTDGEEGNLAEEKEES